MTKPQFVRLVDILSAELIPLGASDDEITMVIRSTALEIYHAILPNNFIFKRNGQLA